jgi:hypothetical protein
MGRAPRASGQAGDGPTDSEIQAFDERGLNPPGEAVGGEALAIVFGFAEQDLVSDFCYPTAAVAFDDLSIK